MIISEALKVNPKLNILEKEILLAKALKKTKEFLFAHGEAKMTLKEILAYKFYLHALKKGMPIAYILKQKEFYGLEFFVNKSVLIPRPDTEIMVEETLKLASNAEEKIILIDAGTGSGCIPISILKNLSLTKNIECLAVDISNKALKVAQKNAKFHNVKIKFLHGNLLKPILKKYFQIFAPQSLTIITANLPYLNKEQMFEPTIKYEPKTALYGGKNNGLEIYQKLFKQIKEVLNSKTSLSLLIEIDPSQSNEIIKIINNAFINNSIKATEIIKDLCGNDRVVKIIFN